MIKKKDLIYVTETSLPTKSANIINSLKFCDSLSNYYDVKFFVPNNSLDNIQIEKIYNLKNKIEFINLTKKDINNFRSRIFFCLKVFLKIIFEKKPKIILGRSIISSLFLTFFNIKNTLELHHKPQSFSKIFFDLILLLPQKKKLNLILINKSLIIELKLSNMNCIVLDDGADCLNYTSNRNIKTRVKRCIYVGSFYKGKGIEIIDKLSKMMPKVQFHLYGDIKTLNYKINYCFNKNIKFFNYVTYNKIQNILKNYELALMPFQDKINARSQNLEISNYISPLKMFDYLSAGKILIATNLKAYKHILKNNTNSFLLSNKDISLWMKLIYKILKKPENFTRIKINAFNTAKKYSWDKRAKSFFNFIEN